LKLDIYKCPFLKIGGRELKFSYIIVLGLGGLGVLGFLFYYKYLNTTRLPILEQRRHAGVMMHDA
jgi:hypothetical protein